MRWDDTINKTKNWVAFDVFDIYAYEKSNGQNEDENKKSPKYHLFLHTTCTCDIFYSLNTIFNLSILINYHLSDHIHSKTHHY